MESQEETTPGSLWRWVGRAVGQGIVEEGRSWLRWAGGGAVVGAVIGGGAGLHYLGLPGLGVGSLAGLIIGAIGAWLLYIWGTCL